LPEEIVSEVPEILTIDDKHRNARRVVFGWAMAAPVMACILAGSTFS